MTPTSAPPAVQVSPNAANPVVLALDGITRRFGQVMALDKASVSVRSGTVHALLGENGAGKTTLMRVAFGLVQPDAGSIVIAGTQCRVPSPTVALAAGIGMVHQHFTLVPTMSVAENVALGGSGWFNTTHWNARVREIGERTGLALDPGARVADLSVGAQQRCEIVKALARHVRILILDEPTAVLAPAEAQDLLQWIRAFASEGHAVVLITHKLRDALAIADDVTVLRRGKTIVSKRVRETSEPELVSAMLGDESELTRAGNKPTPGHEFAGQTHELMRAGNSAERASASAPSNAEHNSLRVTLDAARKSPSKSIGTERAQASSSQDAVVQAHVEERPVVLQLQDATVRDSRGIIRLDCVTLAVRGGELVGVAGIEGSGQRELLRLLAGRVTSTSGTVMIPATVGFVPEDRHADALVLDASLIENVALRGAGVRRGRMPWGSLVEATRLLLTRHHVLAAGAYAKARTLSGGNQQKLIVARELADAPSALIVENPTRGLDFRSTTAVHESLRDARANGAAVVVYSSDLDEVLALADRVLVVREGRVMNVHVSREAVGLAMLGAR